MTRSRRTAHEANVLAYQALSQRHSAQDAMHWETPTLAMTAQAFLLTIAFSPSAPVIGRIVVGLLGAFVAIAAMQLMSKHRLLAVLDQQKMEELEELLELPPIAQRSWGERRRGWHGRSSVLWQFVLGAFAFTSLLAVAVAIADIGGFPVTSWLLGLTGATTPPP